MIVVVFLFVAILFAVVTYISTMSLIPSLIVGFLSFSLLCLFCLRNLNRYKLITSRFHSCYRFINNFIISLSVKNTIAAALESVVDTMDEEFKKEFNEISHLNDFEKIQYLRKFYRFHVYDLFLNIVNLHIEQGGNILHMSNQLVDKIRTIEEYLNNSQTIGIRKITEFIVLWAFTIMILLSLRFVLGTHYELMASQLFYQIGVGVFLLFVVFSISLMIKRFSETKIGGWSYDKV